MTTWQRVWRDGFAKVISRTGLLALRKALKHDDHRITQGSTTQPPPQMNVIDCPVEAACALGYSGWQIEGGCETVGQVEQYFERICFEADQRLGEPAACRWFLNWYDETPRPDMIRSLLEEIEIELKVRAKRTKRRRLLVLKSRNELAIAC